MACCWTWPMFGRGKFDKHFKMDISGVINCNTHF